MNNEMYQRVLITAEESQDGETPTRTVVTQENNGYAVWFDSYDVRFMVEPKLYFGRDEAIDLARDYADKRREGIRRRAGLDMEDAA